MKVLAIDPGYERVGIAILERKDDKSFGANTQRDELLYSDCFQTSSKDDFHHRLLLIGQEINRLIIKYEPTVMSIEKLFFTTNQKTAMGVSEARGVIIYEAVRHGLKIFEYTPLEIKIATTGYGKSDKKQMISMVPKLISINKKITKDDEYDAIAGGITCLASYKAI